MKKRTVFISLVLVSLLTALMPTAALAKAPTSFSASGTVTGINDGSVFPAGNSGRYVVASRTITGTLAGDITGDFTLDYKANVELATQAGNLHGTLQAGAQVLEVNGTIEPLQFVGWLVPPGVHPLYPDGIPLYQLDINGHWTAVRGGKGNGDFKATVIFIPTPDGHVYSIVASAFIMTGQQ